MIGAIITLSIIAFVSLCLNVVLFILNRHSNRLVGWIEDFSKSSQFVLERLSRAIEDVEWHFNHPPENPTPLKTKKND